MLPQIASNQPLADFLLHKNIAQRHFFANQVRIFPAKIHSKAEDSKGVMRSHRKDRKAGSPPDQRGIRGLQQTQTATCWIVGPVLASEN